MTSPSVKVNGTEPINGVVVPPNTSVSIELMDTAGVTVWDLKCLTTDDGQSADAVNSTVSIDHITKTATFDMPVAVGSSLIFESKVNNGYDINGVSDPSLTTTFKVLSLTSAGLRLAAFNESMEDDPEFGWTKVLNDTVRSVGGGTTVVAGDGLVQSGVNLKIGQNADNSILINAHDIQLNPTVINAKADNTINITAGNGLTGGGDLTANRTLAVLAADSSVDVSAGGIKVNTITDLIHGNRAGGTLHADATISVSGFMSAVDKSKLDNATSAATASTLALRNAAGKLLATSFENNAGSDTLIKANGTNNAILDCGSGSAVSVLRYNGNNVLAASSSGIVAYSQIMFSGVFDGKISAFATESGTGKNLTVEAQSVITGAGTGGNLILNSGNGTTDAGNIEINRGTVNKITIDATGSTFGFNSTNYIRADNFDVIRVYNNGVNTIAASDAEVYIAPTLRVNRLQKGVLSVVTDSTASYNIDLSNDNIFEIQLAGTVTKTITHSGGLTGQECTIIFKKGASTVPGLTLTGFNLTYVGSPASTFGAAGIINISGYMLSGNFYVTHFQAP